MNTLPSNRFAVVADARSLMRDLLRFLLEQQGFSVASETSTGAAAVEAVAEHHPDVVILHEAIALDTPDAIQRIRETAPDSTIVVLTANRDRAAPWLTAAADAVVEEGAGLQDLAAVLAAGAGVTVAGWTPRPAPGPGVRRGRGQRWTDRLQGAVAASILMLAVVFATNVETPAPAEGMDAAYASLETLAEGLPEASVEQAVSLATTLISERAMLRAASVDVTGLDADIAETIAPILPLLSPEVSRAVRELLGDLLIQPMPSPSVSNSLSPEPEPPRTETPEPPRTETPEPPALPTPTESPPSTPTESPPSTPTESPPSTPTESPPSTPTESPPSTPTESPPSTPTESPPSTPTESPPSTPTESPSPSPSESASPTNTATPTDSPPATESPTAAVSGVRAKSGNGAILVVPPGLVVLLGSSGAARWLRRRRR